MFAFHSNTPVTRQYLSASFTLDPKCPYHNGTNYLIYEDQCNFLIVGDFNSRVGRLKDYVEHENRVGFNLLPDDYAVDDIRDRMHKDDTVNKNC